jgi:hypothetical protein
MADQIFFDTLADVLAMPQGDVLVLETVMDIVHYMGAESLLSSAEVSSAADPVRRIVHRLKAREYDARRLRREIRDANQESPSETAASEAASIPGGEPAGAENLSDR